MAEGAGLLNQYTGNCITGSNPVSSAPMTPALRWSVGVCVFLRSSAKPSPPSGTFPGAARELAEDTLSVSPMGTAPRLAPDGHRPRLASLTAQGHTVTVRTFDAGGAPADANFAFAARRA